jgi:hypothetical protein
VSRARTYTATAVERHTNMGGRSGRGIRAASRHRYSRAPNPSYPGRSTSARPQRERIEQ